MLNENTFEKNDIMAPQRYVEVECHFRLTDLAMWPFCLIWDYSVPWILHMLRKQEVSYFKQTLPGLARVTGNKFHTWQETSVGCENGHFPQYRSLCQMPRSHITGASVRSHGLDGKGTEMHNSQQAVKLCLLLYSAQHMGLQVSESDIFMVIIWISLNF